MRKIDKKIENNIEKNYIYLCLSSYKRKKMEKKIGFFTRLTQKVASRKYNRDEYAN